MKAVFVPILIGIVALWLIFSTGGNRIFIPIASFFLILGFSNIKIEMKPLEILGDASYSIYLIHPLVFIVAYVAADRLSLPPWSQEPLRFGCFATIIAISIMNWRFFERPITRLGSLTRSLA